MKVYIMDVSSEIEYPDFQRLLNLVSLEKREKINRFKKAEDANRALMAELLARYAICGELGISNNEIEFEHNQYGKPSLKGNNNVHFNVSHSGKWVVCAIDSEEIGIDVQEKRNVDLEIAERFFSKEECAKLKAREEDEQENFFFDLWTLKESYIKAVGKGLSIPLDSFTIDFSIEGIGVIQDEVRTDWKLKQYFIDEEYKLAVCSKNNNFPEAVLPKDLAEIINSFI